MYLPSLRASDLKKPSILRAKRVIDIAVSASMLLLSPLLLAIALVIRIYSQSARKSL